MKHKIKQAIVNGFLASALLLAGCSNNDDAVERSEESSKLELDAPAQAAIASSDKVIRRMTASCDGSMMALSDLMIAFELRGATKILSDISVESADDIQKLNGDFDQKVTVNYYVDGINAVKPYYIRGFYDDMIDGTSTSSPDLEVKNGRWEEARASKTYIAAAQFKIKDGATIDSAFQLPAPYTIGRLEKPSPLRR